MQVYNSFNFSVFYQIVYDRFKTRDSFIRGSMDDLTVELIDSQ